MNTIISTPRQPFIYKTAQHNEYKEALPISIPVIIPKSSSILLNSDNFRANFRAFQSTTQYDKLLYIIDLVYRFYLSHPEKYKKSGVPICTKVLAKKIGRYPTKSINALLDLGILEHNTEINYRADNYCTNYRFKHPIENDKIEIRHLIPQRKNCWKWKLQKRRSSNFGIAKLQENVLINKVSISLDGIKFLEKKYGMTGTKSPIFFSDIEPQDIGFVLLAIKDIRVKRDKESRLYTNLTWLKKEYRKYVLIDNKPIFWTDITSSQIVFGLPVIQDILMNQYNSFPDDYYKFRDIVLDGDIYEYLALKRGYIKEGEALKGKKRDKFKKLFFRDIWYARIYNAKGELKKFDKGLAKIFRLEFPSIFEALLIKKKDNYKDFPIELQTTEAKFILDTICIKLINMGITSCLSIHDSIVVNSEAILDFVEDLMQEEFQKQFGFVPNFKRD